MKTKYFFGDMKADMPSACIARVIVGVLFAWLMAFSSDMSSGFQFSVLYLLMFIGLDVRDRCTELWAQNELILKQQLDIQHFNETRR